MPSAIAPAATEAIAPMMSDSPERFARRAEGAPGEADITPSPVTMVATALTPSSGLIAPRTSGRGALSSRI